MKWGLNANPRLSLFAFEWMILQKIEHGMPPTLKSWFNESWFNKIQRFIEQIATPLNYFTIVNSIWFSEQKWSDRACSLNQDLGSFCLTYVLVWWQLYKVGNRLKPLILWNHDAAISSVKSTEFGVNDFGIPIIRFILYSEWGKKEFFSKYSNSLIIGMTT